eukprot:5806808-Lingulodinium_polyedra.AAC.1
MALGLTASSCIPKVVMPEQHSMSTVKSTNGLIRKVLRELRLYWTTLVLFACLPKGMESHIAPSGG